MIRKIRNFTSLVIAHPDVRAFSKSVTLRLKTAKTASAKDDQIILLESQQAFSNQIALSYFAPALSEFHQAKLISYTMLKNRQFSSIKEKIRNRNSIYFSFGAKSHLIIDGSRSGYWRKYSQVIKSPNDLEKFAINGIRLGDLIYDTYLRRSKNPTIDFKDRYFIDVFDECVSYFHSFASIFESKKIKGVCVSHCVYHFAIPLRIAVHYGIDAFQVTGESVYRLSKTETHAYKNFKHYVEKFKLIDPNLSIRGLEKAKENLEYRLNGNLSTDMPYSTKSSFERPSNVNVDYLEQSRKTKILVAIHDFFDSPHSYGDNFYPDFVIWLEALGKISLNTDYDWYIKTHRDPIGNPDEFLAKFIEKYSKFRVVHRDIDHISLIEQGIDLVLTVYGTIAMEYPYLGIPVINASRNNPHVAYSFSVSPTNVDEYEQLIRNLDNLSTFIDKSQIIEYYFMAHIFEPKSLYYHNYKNYLDKVGGYKKSIGIESLRYFIKHPCERVSDEHLMFALFQFIESKDYKLERKHYPFACKLHSWETDD